MKAIFLRYAIRNALVVFLVVLTLTAVLPAVFNFTNPAAFWHSWTWILFDKLVGPFAVLLAVVVFLGSLWGPRVRGSRSQSAFTMGRNGQFMQDGYDVQGRPMGLEDD